MAQELATFGAVHLSVTNLQRSVAFWRDNIGLQVRHQAAASAELGTDASTLVVLHAGAKSPFQEGYSGIYHLAIHPATEGEFARVLARLMAQRYPISPTDHTMSKAIYLVDPDGITVEITLETPERLARMEFGPRGPVAIDADGTVRGATAALDVQAVLKTLPDHDLTRSLPADTKVGHVHLYVSDMEAAHRFYKHLGFLDNMTLPQYGMADLGAGGAFGHRIAVNAGHTRNRPQAPAGTAGLRYFTIRFDSPERLQAALQAVPAAREHEGGYLVADPAGNQVLLTA